MIILQYMHFIYQGFMLMDNDSYTVLLASLKMSEAVWGRTEEKKPFVPLNGTVPLTGT